MQESYKQFKAEIQKINFSHIQQSFAQLGENSIPKLQLFQPEIELQHKLKSFKNWSTFRKLLELLFENDQSIQRLHQKLDQKFQALLDVVGRYFSNKFYSQQTLQFLTKTFRNSARILSDLVLKQIFDKDISQTQVISLGEMYSQQVEKQSRINSQSKQIFQALDINYEMWSFLAECAKVHIEQEMYWWCSNGDKQLQAIQLVVICLWAYRMQCEVSNKNSPTKK